MGKERLLLNSLLFYTVIMYGIIVSATIVFVHFIMRDK